MHAALCEGTCRFRRIASVLLSAAMLSATFLSATLPSPGVQAQDADWKIGLAAREITPKQRIHLSGYANRDRPFERVESPLWLKALAIENRNGVRGIWICSDLIGYRAEFSDPIRRQITEQTGVPVTNIVLNSSHTHTGPLVTINPDYRANGMTEQQSADTVAYTRQLMEDTAAVAAEALKDLQPAELSWNVGVVHFVMNRREFTERGVRLGVNPRGLADRSVPVLKITSPTGELRAVLFGAACHNTTLTGEHYFVSGDYAGFAQLELQNQLPAVQAMFVMGCGGSANPYPRGTLEDAQAHGAELAGEVSRLLQAEGQPIRGTLTIQSDYVELPLSRPPGEQQLQALSKGGGWQQWVAQQILDRQAAGEPLPDSYRSPVSVWQFGQDLTMVALPGEVVVDYVPLLEQALGPLNLWVTAYNNDVFGYLPSRQVLAEGGYETRGMIYGGIGFFDPRCEEAMVAKVCELAHSAGRQIPQSGAQD